jgi:S-layer protein
MAIANTAQITQISALYVSLFNRAPDTAGLSFWSSALANGASLTAITAGFLNAPEGQANFPSFQSGSEFVTAFYGKVFGRAPDAGGLAFWTAALTSAGGPSSDAAKVFIISQIVNVVSAPLTVRPAGITDVQYTQSQNDRALFANKIDAGTYIATQSSLTEANAKLVFYGVGPAFTPVITADVNTVINAKSAILSAGFAAAVTGNTAYVGTQYGDVFTVSAAALQAATDPFSLDGGAGIDRLILTNTASGAVSMTSALKNVSNVESIQATATGAANTITVDATKFVGATTFGSINSTAAVIFNGLAAGQVAEIFGASFFGRVAFNYVAAATTATLSITGASVSTNTTTLAGAGLTTAIINSVGAGANNGAVALAGTIGAITINATTNFGVELTGATAGASLTITGMGRVDLGGTASFKTINAAAASGGMSAYLDTGTPLTSLIGSAGMDKITIGAALAAGVTMSLGDGDDSVVNSNGRLGSIGAGSTLDAGAGIDTLGSSLVTASNAAVFKNFELLLLEVGSIVDASLLTGSTLTGLVLAQTALGTSGIAVNNLASNVGLTVTSMVTGSGTTTIGVAGALANTADVFGITLTSVSGVPAQAGTIGLANIETINLASGGTRSNSGGSYNGINIADAALKTLNIAATQTTTASFGTVTTATSLIDGSASTGSLIIDTLNLTAATAANGGLTIKGGTADDMLTVRQVATVTGGAGADVFKVFGNTITAVAPTAVELVAKLVTITDFSKGDTIGLRSTNFGGTGVLIAAVSDQSAAADLLTAATAAANLGGNAAGIEVNAFRFGGDTYVLLDASASNTGGVTTGDVLVKLSGVVDLSTTTFTSVNGNLIFA